MLFSPNTIRLKSLVKKFFGFLKLRKSKRVNDAINCVEFRIPASLFKIEFSHNYFFTPFAPNAS